MKRTACYLILAALLVSSFAACGGGNTPTVTTAPAIATETEPPETEYVETFDAEVKDLDGKDVTIFIEGNWATTDFEAEEMTGEALNDAVYQTNSAVMQMYNVKLKTENVSGKKTSTTGQGVGYQTITNVNMAGTNDYDFAYVGCYDVSTLSYNGQLLDLNKLKNIDLTKSWWDPKANEQLSIKGKMFYSTGDIGVLDNNCTYCILFNKQVIENFKLDNPYELVRENKWLYDKMIEMADACDSDLNGDGVLNNDDAYGLLIWQDSVIGMLHGSGGRCATIEDDGTIKLTLNTERNVDVLTTYLTDRTRSFSYFLEAGTDDAAHATFTGNRNLFYTRYLRAASWFRDLEADFGMLPYPKWTDDQDSYCNTMHAYGTSFVCFPLVSATPDDTAAVVEALAYYGQQYITPAYYDVNLKGKYFRDEESAEMLDIIFATRFFDVGMYYEIGTYNEQVIKMMQQNNTDFASMYAKYEEAAKTKLKQINEAFAAMP